MRTHGQTLWCSWRTVQTTNCAGMMTDTETTIPISNCQEGKFMRACHSHPVLVHCKFPGDERSCHELYGRFCHGPNKWLGSRSSQVWHGVHFGAATCKCLFIFILRAVS
ncbi:hypothetical protein KC19_VG012400 [Ceratodon purpureus]|uniref:Uncharacterized protein n=1 Tax=Ceratodon purpureus TaxID=3225 RepID=A0A8T0HL28_CERPU|nr:hypothetical protein KC19_VG012400 [Ceratodon purpureus]